MQRVETMAVCRLACKPAEAYGKRAFTIAKHENFNRFSAVFHETRYPSGLVLAQNKIYLHEKISKIIKKNVVLEKEKKIYIFEKRGRKKGRTLVKRPPVLWNTR